MEQTLKPLPMEITEEFASDIRNMLMTVEDEDDEALIDSVKVAIQMFIRSKLTPEDLTGLFEGIQEEYSGNKRSPNAKLINATKEMLRHAIKFKARIASQTERYIG